jgi:hypothetical protein
LPVNHQSLEEISNKNSKKEHTEEKRKRKRDEKVVGAARATTTRSERNLRRRSHDHESDDLRDDGEEEMEVAAPPRKRLRVDAPPGSHSPSRDDDEFNVRDKMIMDQAHRYEQLGQHAGHYHYDPVWAGHQSQLHDLHHQHQQHPIPPNYQYSDQVGPPTFKFPQLNLPYPQHKDKDFDERSQSGHEADFPSPTVSPTLFYQTHLNDPPYLQHPHPIAHFPKRDTTSPPIVILPHEDPNDKGKKKNFDLQNPLPFSNRKVRDKISNSNKNFTAIHFPPLNPRNKTYKQ